jgi:CBS domain-containing protein
MDEYRVAHLPITNESDLLGIISDEDINTLNHLDEAIGNHRLSLPRLAVTEEQHIYDVIHLFMEHNLTLLPVTNAKDHYLGVITLENLAMAFGEMSAAVNPGGVIILEINERDYSLSEIAQIVESNDALILSLFIHSLPDSTKMEVTLKVNKMDIAAIIQTFNRYDYIIKATFSEGDYDKLLRDRFDSLMSYLNI